MRSFLIKAVNLLLILLVILGYNLILGERAKTEAREKKAYEEQLALSERKGKYKNGSYRGSAEGFGGLIEVEVFVEKGDISKIDIISADQEDKAYLDTASAIIDSIVKAQDPEVDTISGATFSSRGIKNAARTALQEAGKEKENETNN